MIDLIDNYFKTKKIDALVKDSTSAFSKIIYDIQLNDISKLNKFNNNMIKELKLLLKCDVEIVNNDKLQIIVHKNINNATSDILKIKIGNTLDNQDVYISVIQEVHLLVAGSTGSGKSVFLNNLINDLIKGYNEHIEFCFIDLKKVELARYKNLNTCIGFADELDDSLMLLDNVIDLMNERYNKYKEYNVLNIQEYNKLNIGNDRYLILVIDELAELMLQNKKEVQNRLQRILQLGRASGIHVVACTQRPSADIVAGTLKVNFTSRICFKVANRHDSTTILNSKGAELLSGNGDGYLLKNGSTELMRFQALKPTNNKALYENIKQDTSTQDVKVNSIKMLVAFTILTIIISPLLIIAIVKIVKYIIFVSECIFTAIVMIMLLILFKR